MLDGIDTPTALNPLAAWILGTAFVVLVIGFAMAVIQWSGGKIFGQSDGAVKGWRGVWLTFAGALLLGSIGGAIQWSSAPSRTEALLPAEAGQRSITVERESADTSCGEQVTVAPYGPGGEFWDDGVLVHEDDWDDETYETLNKGAVNDMSYQDLDAQVELAFEMDLDDLVVGSGPQGQQEARDLLVELAGDNSDITDHYGSTDIGSMDVSDSEQIDGTMGGARELFQITEITWTPDGEDGDCSEDNTTPESGSVVTVDGTSYNTSGLNDWPRNDLPDISVGG